MWLHRAVHQLGPGASAMQRRSQRVVARFLSAPPPVAAETAVEAVASSPPKKKPRTAKPAATVSIAQTPSSSPTDADRILYQYPTLVPARLLRRYKRFLADVVLAKAGDEDTDDYSSVDESQAITIYCPNTGPMVGLLDEPNARVQLSKSDDPKRKYAYTLEMIRVHNGERHVWVGVHSTSANYMVEKAIVSGWFTPQLGVFHALQREVSFAKNSRVDFVLSRHDGDGNVVHQKYVEVKSVTLAWPAADVSRCAVFPDTVSDRAAKHVTELMELIESRKRTAEDKPATTKRVELSGAIVFLVQRDDCESFMPSLIHDAKFARLCAEAEAMGIQLLPYLCRLEPDEHGQRGHVRLLHALSLHADRTKATPEAGGDAKKPSVSIKTKKAASSKKTKK